jgi:predicted nucleotidyltransferase
MTPTLLSIIAGALEEAGIPYALVGAAALAVHGVSRSTLDQDLLVTDRRALDRDLWRTLTDVSVDVRRGDSDDPLAGVVRFTAHGQRDVDVIVGRHAWQASMLARARRVPLGARAIPVVGVSDLILLKLYAGGAQDRWDIAQLLAAVASPQVEAEVEQGLAELPGRCGEMWRGRERL